MAAHDSSRPPYEPSRGFVARRAFLANGRRYKPGDRFDPRKAECDARRQRQLWESRFIDCVADVVEESDSEDAVLSDLEASELEG